VALTTRASSLAKSAEQRSTSLGKGPALRGLFRPLSSRSLGPLAGGTRAVAIAYWNVRDRGFVPALTKAGLTGKGITIHGLRSAAISLYAARGLSMLETATIMGQADPGVTWKHYARLFDRSDVEARVRAAQASLGAPLEKDSGGDF
jgi:integrase